MAEETTAQTTAETAGQGNTESASTSVDTSQTTTTQAADTTIEKPVTATWRDGLSDEYKSHDAFKDITDLNALFKDHLDLKQAKEDLTKSNEELAGKVPKVPEAADKYVVDIPAGLPKDDTFISEMKNAAFKAGMGQEQFKVMADHYIALQASALEFVRKEQEAGMNALKIEWPGSKYDENVTVAQQAFKKFAPTDDESKYLKDTGMANDPVLIRIFQRVGSAISEDFSVEGDGGTTGSQATTDGKPTLDFNKSFPKK
jgi:hypothetical protein